MLENGFGEHNIQGIGDKHIPLIHNVMNTDVVCAVSDRATDELDVLFNTPEGRGVPGPPQGRPRGGRRRARALRLLLDLQRAGRDQDGEAARPRSGRRRDHRGHRRRRALPERAGQDDRPPLRRVLRRPGRGRGVRRAPRHRPAPTTSSSAPSATGPASSTWATTPGWSSRARRWRSSRPGGPRRFWRGLRRYLPVWDELIVDFNARVAADG